MILKKLSIKNFRGYKNSTFDINKLNVIIGKNDVGKSTILDALEIFFNDTKPEKSDLNVYNKGNTSIDISCAFKVNPNEPIQLDSGESDRTETTLAEEYLLNSDGLLEISKHYDLSGASVKISYNIIAKHPNNFTKSLLTLKLKDLKQEAKSQGISLKTADVRIKKEIRKEIYQNSDLTFSDNFEIETNSKDTDIICLWEKIKTQLPTYMIFRADRTNTDKDKEVNETTKAITKTVVSSLETDFEEIKLKINKSIRELAEKTLSKLKEFDENIANQLNPNIEAKGLDTLFSFTFNCDDNISFNKRGSGVKRLMLLSFFLAEAERNYGTDRNIIYAIEEPETSQHPDFQVLLFNALKDLSEKENHQIIITTHTPEIVKLINKENLIFLQKENNQQDLVIQQNDSIEIRKVAETLGILPLICNKYAIFIEGPTDEHFLKHLNQYTEFNDIFNLNTCSFIISHGCGNIDTWIKKDYLSDSNIKCLYFKDRDDSEDTNTNTNLILTNRREIENYIPYRRIENEFEITFQPDEISNWNNLDVPKAILNKLQSSNPQIKETQIKNQLQSTRFWQEISYDELDYEEISSWFTKIKDFFDEA